MKISNICYNQFPQFLMWQPYGVGSLIGVGPQNVLWCPPVHTFYIGATVILARMYYDKIRASIELAIKRFSLADLSNQNCILVSAAEVKLYINWLYVTIEVALNLMPWSTSSY